MKITWGTTRFNIKRPASLVLLRHIRGAGPVIGIMVRLLSWFIQFEWGDFYDNYG